MWIRVCVTALVCNGRLVVVSMVVLVVDVRCVVMLVSMVVIV